MRDSRFWTVAVCALLVGASAFAGDSEYLLWMVDNPTITRGSGTVGLSNFTSYDGYKVNSARIVVSGDGVAAGTYLNIYQSSEGGWRLAELPQTGVNAGGYAGPIWSDLGIYADSAYSFTVELGSYNPADKTWYVLAVGELTGYSALVGQWATSDHVNDVPGTIEWTGGAYTAPVPEPSCGLLVLMGGALLALRRRRVGSVARVARSASVTVAAFALCAVFSDAAAATLTLEDKFERYWKEGKQTTVQVPLIYEDEDGKVLAGQDKTFTVGGDGEYPDINPNAGYAMEIRTVESSAGSYWGTYNPSIINMLELDKLLMNGYRYEFVKAMIRENLDGEWKWSGFSSEDNKTSNVFDIFCQDCSNGGDAQAYGWMASRKDSRNFPLGEGVEIKLVYRNVGICGGIESCNTFGMATIYSTDTNTIVAVPWTWYSKRELDAESIFARKLVSPENLSPGDFLLLLSNNVNYAAWALDSNLKWQPAPTVTLGADGLSHTAIFAGESNVVSRGYGLWLVRSDPLNADGTPKPFYVYGQFVKQGATATVRGGGTRAAPVFTMLADPRLREVKVNEDIDWGANPGAIDSLAIVTDQATFLYCKWDAASGKWWYPRVAYDESAGQTMTERVTDIRVPAGAGFWYVRRTDGDFTVTWDND